VEEIEEAGRGSVVSCEDAVDDDVVEEDVHGFFFVKRLGEIKV